jgi:hypothetical protein
VAWRDGALLRGMVLCYAAYRLICGPSARQVQSTLGLDATYAAQLSAPFYSWTSAAWDALVVPIPCDDDECSVVRSPRSEYTLGLVRTLHAQFWRIGKGVPPRLQTGAKVSTTKQVKESVDTSVFEFSRLPCQRLSFWTSDLENPAAGETLMKPVGVAMARGQVGPWVMGQCMEVQQGQGDGWVSARAAVRSARCTVHYKTQAAFDVLGVLLYVGGAACVLAMGVQWHRRTSAAAFSAC